MQISKREFSAAIFSLFFYNLTMSVYLINYDLNKTKDYEAVYTAIKSCGSCARVQDSCWAVDTNLTRSEVWRTVWKAIDNDDYLLVTRLAEASWSKSHKDDVQKWLKDHVK